MFLSSLYSNVFVRYVHMVEDREFSAFQEKKTTPYFSMLLCFYILMESPFHTKEFGVSFSRVCVSYDFINKCV